METYDTPSGPEQSISGDEQDAQLPEILNSVENEDEFRFDDLLPKRRHSISSVESEYEPDTEDEDGGKVKIQKGKRDFVPPEEDSGNRYSSPLKRSFPSPTREERPFKRLRGTFNHKYLELLNADIEDAASLLVADNDDGKVPLLHSQIGLIEWSATEKELFFEALARLGPNNALGIAARIQTKSELEVLQYLQVLHSAAEARKHRKELELVQLTDIPAAVELSQVCCSALEEAGDAISVRQEAHEELVEERRWGSERWLITQDNHRDIEKEGLAFGIKSAELFRCKNWLQLSERVFMNASFDEYNWSSMSDEKPAIRTTALEDFYSLVVSVTRRLVAASIYVAESRIRTKQDSFDPDTANLVLTQDAEAAILDLNMPENSHRFWAGCARRLRLNVVVDEDPYYQPLSEDQPELFMSYKAVEAALAQEGEDRRQDSESDSDSDLESNTAADVGIEGNETDAEEEDDAKVPTYPGVREENVKRDLKELLGYSVLGLSETTRSKQALKSRIRLAHSAEAYADAVDMDVSYQEESGMWKLMERARPEEAVKPRVPEPPISSVRQPIDDMLYTSRNWRDALGPVKAWWEVDTTVEKTETPAALDTPVTPRR